MAKKSVFEYITISSVKSTTTFQVKVDGIFVGTIIHFWIKHLEMMGWEAIGPDGHRAVHKNQLQASKALVWDGKGYPMPFSNS